MSEAAEPTRVVLRTITTLDVPFIVSSWLRSNRKRGYRHLHPELYTYWHHRVLEALIPASKVIVACDREKLETIYGYGVAQPDASTLLVHYLYVRHGWRGVGIGRSIVEALLERFQPSALAWTHETQQWEDFVKALRRAGVLTIPGIHNPYLAFRQWARSEAEERRRV